MMDEDYIYWAYAKTPEQMLEEKDEEIGRHQETIRRLESWRKQDQAEIERLQTGNSRNRLSRKWINQPSTLQPYHFLHGRCVIYDPNTGEIWFPVTTSISQKIAPEALSDGWPRTTMPD